MAGRQRIATILPRAYIEYMKAVMPDTLDADITAYEKLLPTLKGSIGKWVLVCKQELVGVFDSSELAAAEAVKRFGRGPYLIRQIGAPPTCLPASVMFCPGYA
jgi:hypothetical protein